MGGGGGGCLKKGSQGTYISVTVYQSFSVPKLLKFRLLFAYLLFLVDIGHLEQAGDGDFPSERWLGSGEIVSPRSDLVKKSRMCFRTATFPTLHPHPPHPCPQQKDEGSFLCLLLEKPD